VLIVDDLKLNRRLASASLDRLGVEYAMAENGLVAVELAKRHVFDLILMDVAMPELNGHDATRRIREWEAGVGRHSLIVGLSANVDFEDRQAGLEAGMDDYLCKPITLEGIRAALLKHTALDLAA